MAEQTLLPALVGEYVSTGNYIFMTESRQRGMTIYGDIAAALEGQTDNIQKLSEHLATYWATKKGIQITQEYENNSTFWGKYIANNPLLLKKMEHERSGNVDMTSTLVQGSVNVLNWATKKILTIFEQKTIKSHIWGQFLIYANAITNNDVNKFPAIKGYLQYLSRQLFGKEQTDFSVDEEKIRKCNNTVICLNNAQEMQIAVTLYTIYTVKEYNQLIVSEEERQRDKELLMNMWARLGLILYEADALFTDCKNMNFSKSCNYGIMNQLIQSFSNNLSITLPTINKDIARNVNRELRLYTPNGAKQAAVRKGARFVSKAAIAAICSAGGISTENPQLLLTAATTALSMFQNIEEPEKVAQCLLESGVPEENIKKCIEDSRKSQNKLQPLL